MDINNHSNQELLSAYLDDALTEAELVQVDRWLASDPSAVDYLNELRSNRHTLKALASLPGVGLRGSLADRVLAQATHNGLGIEQAPVRLRPTAEEKPTPSWRSWATFLATAAALVSVAALPLLRYRSEPQGLISQVPVESAEPSVGELATSQAVVASEANTLDTPSMPAGGRVVDSSHQTPEERHDLNDLVPVQMVLIVDVLMSEQAWESAKFDQLLSSYGIRFEKQVVAKPELIEGLIKSPVDVGADADIQTRQSAALVYLRCPLNSLSQLLVDIEKNRIDFPEMDIKMAMSGGPLGLGDHFKLLSLLREPNDLSVGRGLARLVVPQGRDDEVGKLLPAFDMRIQTAPESVRDGVAKRLASHQGNIATGNKNGELLFVLRKAK